MKVVEIFKSIDGEGIRAGFPVTFIRLFGCNLNCSYCDSRYACEETDGTVYTEMTVDEIFNQVYKMGSQRITLTGGEPLIHTDVMELIDKLTDKNFKVNIETNGSVNIFPFLSGAKHDKRLIFTVDYKCPTSGEESKMELQNLKYLRMQDVLKFVVGSKEDLDVCRRLRQYTNAQVFISPVFGKIEPKEIVEYMLEHDMEDCRIQLQLHKFIWNPEMRGV